MEATPVNAEEEVTPLYDQEIVSYAEPVLDAPSDTEIDQPTTPAEIVLDEVPPIPEVPAEPESIEVLEPEPIEVPEPEPVEALEPEPLEALEPEPIEVPEAEPVVDVERALDGLPQVPDLSEPAEPESPADIEIPEPESASETPPTLEVVSSEDSTPPTRGRRYTRPFIRPSSEDAKAPPAPAPSKPMRPTAPVFRPTPGMPLQKPPPDEPRPASHPPAPPAPPPTVTPTAEVPTEIPPPALAETSAPTAHVTETEPVLKRPVNPFLSKDPKQKARRLARALVSDMIVYQPQKRQEALEAGTLKEAFDEEIKKSWEEYVEQVGEDLASSTEFFKEALNDILAGGNEVF
jgi:hypothetical protein